MIAKRQIERVSDEFAQFIQCDGFGDEIEGAKFACINRRLNAAMRRDDCYRQLSLKLLNMPN